MRKKMLAVFSGVVLLAAFSVPVFAADTEAPAAAPEAAAAPAAAPAPAPAKPVVKPFVKPLVEGDAMPDFTAAMLSGANLKSTELAAKNKTIIVTFIQTACSACKGEIIELNRLAKESKKSVYVLPIAVDMRSGKEFLENYKSENAVSFDFGMDPKFTIPRLFNLSFTPASVLIKDGKVAKIFRGYDETIKAELEALF